MWGRVLKGVIFVLRRNLGKGEKPWNGFLDTGDTEFEERILESVAVSLCWIFLTFVLDILGRDTIRVGISLCFWPLGGAYWNESLNLDWMCMLGADDITMDTKHMSFALKKLIH